MQPKIDVMSVELAQFRSAAKPRRASSHAADGRYSTRAGKLERRSIDACVFAEVIDDDRNLLLHACCSIGDGARWPRS
jgi:hypothetical protein